MLRQGRMTTAIINIMYVIQRQFKSTSIEHYVISSLKWTEALHILPEW